MSSCPAFPDLPLAQPLVRVPMNPAIQIPLVVDSPHSGKTFPTGGRTVATPEQLLTSWDAYVDHLWAGTSEMGGTLIAANFHRAFIDLNRSEFDIDPDMLDGHWPSIQPTVYSSRGMGLIRRMALPGVPMYARKLSVSEVQSRISLYYQPYHQALTYAIDQAHQQFGASWHINCHSMKSVGNAMNLDDGKQRPDLVVSDREGSASDPAFTSWVASVWRDLGYRVSVNDPYKGGDIVRRYGQPSLNRHSIQIEINRHLYMNEKTFEVHDGFSALEMHVRTFLEQLRQHIPTMLRARDGAVALDQASRSS